MKFIKKKKVFLVFLFLVIFMITFSATCFCISVSGDEVWNYGFSYNITKGLIPYRDFNMVITPLYSFLASIFIKVFGNYLFSLHILDAILISIMVLMLFHIIKWKALIVYPVMIYCGFPSYNLLCVFFAIFLLYLIRTKKDYNIAVGILLGLLFLTKQSIGICFFAVYFLHSKAKLKSIISFSIPILIFLIYLIYNEAFYQFIDYCFLGLVDFNEKNLSFINIIFIFECLIISYLIYKLVKSRFQDKEVIYIFVFQFLLYPIVDLYHFLICFVPVVYLIVRDKPILSWGSIVICFIAIGYLFFYTDKQIYFGENYLYLRNVDIDFTEIEKAYSKYKEVSAYQFFWLGNAYGYKLYMDIPITKYDLLNNGNMGYKGDERYVREIDDMCSGDEVCIFFVDKHMYDYDDAQFSKKLFYYVIDTYSKVEEYDNFSVYTN